MLKTMVEKELGLAVEPEEGSPLQGALVMAVAFGLGALVPLLPYLFLDPTQGLWASLIGTGAVLFAIGVAKSRWTRRGWLRSGIEILLLGAFAGVAGYLFGDLLPAILGAPSGG
jgi:VIT1/CCC1 family predicted Fe2+/Mn2+ transporter